MPFVAEVSTPRSRSDKTIRRRENTRERLLDAARAVLAESGIQGTSVEQICESAGFTRGAFYSNFKSKEDLVLATFQREKQRMLEQLNAAIAADRSGDEDDAVTTFVDIIDRFLAMQPFERTWFLVHSEFAIHAMRNPQVGAEFIEVWRQMRAELTTVLIDALYSLGLKLTIDPDDAISILIGTYDLALREAFTSDSDLDRRLLDETFPRVLFAVTEPVDVAR